MHSLLPSPPCLLFWLPACNPASVHHAAPQLCASLTSQVELAKADSALEVSGAVNALHLHLAVALQQAEQDQARNRKVGGISCPDIQATRLDAYQTRKAGWAGWQPPKPTCRACSRVNCSASSQKGSSCTAGTASTAGAVRPTSAADVSDHLSNKAGRQARCRLGNSWMCRLNTPKQAHLHGGAAGSRRLAALGAAHAGGVEGNGDSLLGDVQLQAVPAQHIFAHGGHLARTLQEGKVLLRPAGGSRGSSSR